ncbi:ABC transporter permease [Microbacterium lacticum]
MMRTAFVNEFAKMRHLHVGLLITVLGVVMLGIGLFSSLGSPDFDRATQDSWNTLIGGTGSGITLAAPLLLAVIASRQVDIEHQGNGWLMSATSGVTPGGLCRAKLLALGLLVAGVTVVTSGLIAGAGLLLGITAPFPTGRWIGFTAALLAVNLVLLALHTLIAARVENQLVGIGIGLLGTILALFSTAVPAWISHLTPWGYYALSAASGYVDGTLVAITPAYPSIAALGVVAAAAFLILTRRFDRKEA